MTEPLGSLAGAGSSGRASLQALLGSGFGSFAVAMAIVVAVVAGLAPTVSGHEGGGGDSVEVRIVARHVAGARVEFGLQQLEAGSGWGERLLPRQRFFPARASLGRWLVSTPVVLAGGDGAVALPPAMESTAGNGVQAAAGGGAEVRTAARRVSGGRGEFALQERDADGGWGVRLLPEQRFFPADARVGRWLVSTPLALGVPGGSTTSPPEAGSTTTTGVPPDDSSATTGDDSSATTVTTKTQASLGEQVASLVLDGVNQQRGALPPLALGDGVTIAAQALAQAMADASDWQTDFDFAPHLQADWDVWRFVTARWTSRDPGDPAIARSLSDLVLDVPEHGRAALTCELCTHLGVGVATARGRTYTTVVVAGRAPAGSVIAAAEAEMAALVNTLRAGLGLRALAYDTDIAAVARRWSETMGAEERLYHNPNYWNQYPAGSLTGAENASQVSAPLSLSAAVRRSFDGLVDSPLHYANMVNPDYTHLGVGIALDNGALWVTQNFAQYAPGTRTTAGSRPATETGSTSEPNGDSTPPDSSAGPTPEDPGAGSGNTGLARSVTLAKGRNAQGVHSGCTSANCHYLRVELVNFEPGSYTVYCVHYGVPSAGWKPGYWTTYTTSVTTSEVCIWGVAGHSVYVIVEDPASGDLLRSNDAQWP